ARHGHAICGFAYFARYARLPDWLALVTFEAKNGCPTLESLRERIGGIRARIDYRAQSPSNEIGCILLAQPTFFQPDEGVAGPRDWPPGYDNSERSKRRHRSSASCHRSPSATTRRRSGG